MAWSSARIVLKLVKIWNCISSMKHIKQVEFHHVAVTVVKPTSQCNKTGENQLPAEKAVFRIWNLSQFCKLAYIVRNVHEFIELDLQEFFSINWIKCRIENYESRSEWLLFLVPMLDVSEDGIDSINPSHSRLAKSYLCETHFIQIAF